MGNYCSCLTNKTVSSDVLLNKSKIEPSKMCSLFPNMMPNKQKYVLNAVQFSKLVRLQGVIGGFLFRKNKHRNNKTVLSKDTTAKTFSLIENSSISQEDKDALFKLYPPLNDSVPVEFIQSMYSNQSEYSGELNPKTRERHGRGILICLNKTKYIGQWKNDKYNGKGKLIHPRGDVYEGDFFDDKAEGFGTYMHSNGSCYVGSWKNDLQDGKGKETWPNRTEYEGEYKEGKKSGKGRIVFSDGSIYEGDFYQNLMHGKGKYIHADKRVYEGEMKYNKMDGEGVFTWVDGRKFTGHYYEDQKDGVGTCEWPNGKIYKGSWKNGKRHGEGSLYNPTKKTWKKGLWVENKCVRYTDKNS